MNTQISGAVRMASDTAQSVMVQIHLAEETITLAAANGVEIGTWPLEEVGIASKPDGFHLRIEGEEIILTTDDDARFAVALGITTPTSRLARMMAKLRDETADASVVVDLTDPATGPVPQSEVEPLPPTRRQSRMADGLPYLGPLVIAAAVIAFLASVVAATGGSAISFAADIPAWPAMMAASLVLAAGGFTAFQDPNNGRASIGAGIAIGLIVILFTAGRLVDTGLVGEALLAFTLAVVASGVLLAVDTAGRNDLD